VEVAENREEEKKKKIFFYFRKTTILLSPSFATFLDQLIAKVRVVELSYLPRKIPFFNKQPLMTSTASI